MQTLIIFSSSSCQYHGGLDLGNWSNVLELKQQCGKKAEITTHCSVPDWNIVKNVFICFFFLITLPVWNSYFMSK